MYLETMMPVMPLDGSLPKPGKLAYKSLLMETSVAFLAEVGVECKIPESRIWSRLQQVSPFEALEKSATRDHEYSEV